MPQTEFKLHSTLAILSRPKAADEEEKTELTGHVEDTIAGIDVGKESISKSLSRVSSLHQSSNVHNIEKSWDLTVRQAEESVRPMSGGSVHVPTHTDLRYTHLAGLWYLQRKS